MLVLLSVRGAVSPGLSSNFGLSWMVGAFVRRVSVSAKWVFDSYNSRCLIAGIMVYARN